MSAPKNNAVYIYDRPEGDLYVLTGEEGDISVQKLPEGACCGDSLQYANGEFTIMKGESIARKKRVEDKFSKLFGK